MRVVSDLFIFFNIFYGMFNNIYTTCLEGAEAFVSGRATVCAGTGSFANQAGFAQHC